MTRRAAAKRLLDLGIAAPTFVVALPLCLILLILIRMESPGNPLFVQTRVGRRQRPFRMLKLRTMAAGTAHVPSHEVQGARITRLGGALRRLKLDELPQLWNVLTGSMSLVGPRPCLPSQTELIAAREALDVFEFPPGITGPGQLLKVDMSQPARLAGIEADYFKAATLRTDVTIIMQTIGGRGNGDAAPKRS